MQDQAAEIKLMDQKAISNDLTPGVVKLERVWVICPACGQRVEAVASDGRVRGYCAVARQSVDFLIENPGVVRDYLRGDKTIVIKDRYGVSPGKLYRVLHAANVRLRTSPLDG